MTIREAGKGEVKKKCPASYCIGFNGNDEMELDAIGMDDLKELWKSFCQEFGCEEDSVNYVESV